MRITPNNNLKRHLDRSRLNRPAAVFVTREGLPNIRVTPDSYSDEQMGEVLGALGTLAAEVAKIMFPGYKGKIQGACLLFEAGKKTKEVIDQRRIDTSDYLDYLELSLKLAGKARRSLPKGPPASVLDIGGSLVSVIAKIDDDYHEEPVTDPMKQAISQLPHPKMWSSLHKIYSVITEGPKGA